jgi:muramoyltetrapeptide carboxypeptidase
MGFTNNSLRLTIPRALRPGDCVALVSPASASTPEKIEAGVTYLSSMGLRARVMPSAAERRYYMAGSDAQRLADLHAAFADPDIAGILCLRGGYGCTRLLDSIDWALIAQNPKVFVGFSDITALLTTMVTRSHLLCFHGPMVTSNLIDEDTYTRQSFWDMVMPSVPVTLPLVIPNQHSWQCLHSQGQSHVEGPLMGGNLSLLAVLCGTAYQPDFSGSILFVEDWHEAYYSVDRQWQQLKMAGLLKGVKAVLLADFAEMTPETWPNEAPYPMADYLRDLTADLGIPVGYGFSLGHGPQTATFPVGGSARLSLADGRLEILASVVDPA